MKTDKKFKIVLPSPSGNSKNPRQSGIRSSFTGLVTQNKQTPRKDAIKNMSNYDIIKATTKLSQEEIEELYKQFLRYDIKRIDAIRYDEVDDVFRDMGLDINENHKTRIWQEMDKVDKRYADFKMTCELYVIILQIIEQEIDEANNADYVNAFTALGGNADRSGYIDKNHIIEIIKEEFELTFDINKFLEKKGGDNQQMNYSEFCALFEHGDHMSQDIVSLFSGKNSTLDGSRKQSFKISYKNFNRWSRYDGAAHGTPKSSGKNKSFTRFGKKSPKNRKNSDQESMEEKGFENKQDEIKQQLQEQNQ